MKEFIPLLLNSVSIRGFLLLEVICKLFKLVWSCIASLFSVELSTTDIS